MMSTRTQAEVLIVKNFIGGEFVESERFLDSYNPSTGEVWAKVPDSGEAEVDVAVQAADKAFASWAHSRVSQRSQLLFKIADILESRLEDFAKLESLDQGKPIWLARTMDIPRAVHNFRFFATYILHDLNKSSLQDQVGAVQYTLKEPVGVAGLISPWNLPLYLLTFKIAPALATGNTVVAKPSELTSVTAFHLCEIIKEAGVPPGVVNMVFGLGSRAGEALVAHPKVHMISFTGGTVTAQRIRQVASRQCKKLSLELGGKNPSIVFSDADLDKCIATSIRSSFLNQGEICLCTSRIFVQQEIYQIFLERFLSEMRKLKVGDPHDADTFLGALISKDHLAKVTGMIKAAQESGASVHSQPGELTQQLPPQCKNGFFMSPVVITNIADDAAVMQEEIFGPVTCIVPFVEEKEVIDRANGVKYGLCGVVWSKDLSRAHRVATKIKVGTVWVNCWLVRDLNLPFGGMKESGIGREGAVESVEFFTEQKTVCIQI